MKALIPLAVALMLVPVSANAIDLEVRPGRPAAHLAGLITSSLFGTVAFIGGSFLLIHHLVASDGDGLGPGLIRAGQTMAFGGLAGTALGVGLKVHGKAWVRQASAPFRP